MTNTNEDLRKKIGSMKPHTETQLPLRDLLSHLEMNALIDVVKAEVIAALEKVKSKAIVAQDAEKPHTGEFNKFYTAVSDIEEIEKEYK